MVGLIWDVDDQLLLLLLWSSHICQLLTKFFFLREFQFMTSASDYNFLSSGQNTNQFLV